MFTYLLLGLLGLTIFQSVSNLRHFRRNLKAAQQSGLPYICLPWFPYNTFWLVTHRLWLPVLQRLPEAWTGSWLKFLIPDWMWHHHLDVYRELGDVDMFILVAPACNAVFVANAEVIAQITARRNDFPKPIHFYASLDIYGKNVVTTEGAFWRHHRKITSPPFTEKNNRLVWMESLHQATQMIRAWLPHDSATTSGPVSDVASQAMRLSLHVISRAGFGVRLTWPHEKTESVIPPGHSMTYKEALEILLENLIWILLFPTFLLSRSPFRSHRLASQSYVEWGKYMREMYTSKRDQVQRGASDDGLDLMGALVRGAGFSADAEQSDTDGISPEKGAKQLLTDDEILGNAFVFILAGHETAANSINFSLIYLAMHQDAQQRLQKDLDAIFDHRSVEQWDYEEDVPKLFGGMCGAVMNEELRLIPPVLNIPKSTPEHRAGGISASGQQYTFPGGSFVALATNAVHRNPKYWPHKSLEDLNEFRPERWLLDPNQTLQHTDQAATYEAEEGMEFHEIDQRSDTAPSLFRPPRGAYIPFSEGYRSCLGRRFAQIEILAVLAVIFKFYSVELDVTMFLSDTKLKTASVELKRQAWDKARMRARGLLRTNMSTIITLQMRGDNVPLRLVKRGHEQLRFPVAG